MRTCLALAFVILLALAAVARPVHAQSITLADLQDAALSTDDLPGGFAQVGEQPLSVPGSIDQLYTRVFANTGTRELLGVELLVPAADLPLSEFSPSSTGDVFLQSAARAFSATSGADVQNFTATGSLGIGDDDYSGQWEATNSAAGITLRIYADFFLQGNLLAAVLYGAPIDSADASQLVSYARQQQQKIAGANLGGNAQ